MTPKPPIDKITLVLIGMILIFFAMGAYKVNAQAAQINKIIDEQSPLIFAFPAGGPGNVTFTVNCVRLEGESKYSCTTVQSPPATPLTSRTPTPTPVR